LSGKLGSAVGSTWKGILYARSLVIPANPNTVLQQAQRALMSVIVLYGKILLSVIIQAYWDPFVRGVSGFNAFCKANLDALSNATDWQHFVFATGALEGDTFVSFTYATATGVAHAVWNGSPMGNGDDGDDVTLIIIDTANSMAFADDKGAKRVDAARSFNIGAGRTAANLKGYLFLSRTTTGVLEMVSPTAYVQVTAA
jgi:hypothetical protein